jgi:ATP-binding protein involved in chromosome partitioning
MRLPTEATVLEALRPVQDPELHRSIVDLKMVRSITFDGTTVTVLIALTVVGCPLRAEITTRVTQAVLPLDGIEQVKVDMTVMTPEELQEVRGSMQQSGDHGGHQHGESHAQGPRERPIPFVDKHCRTRVLGISSGKGGVGKSSVTVNLAIALAQQGHEVAILDADVYGFSIPGMLGVEHEPLIVDDMIVPPSAYGVRCVSMGFFTDDAKPVMWRGPMLHKALRQFLADVRWDDPDFLLIDMPPGTGDVAMSMREYVPNAELYVVSTPQHAADRVAQRSGTFAQELKLPLAGVIENMSWFTCDDGKRHELFGAGGGDRLSAFLGVPLLAQIPFTTSLRQGGDAGKPIVAQEPESEAAQAFFELATAIAAMKSTARRRIYLDELKVV